MIDAWTSSFHLALMGAPMATRDYRRQARLVTLSDRPAGAAGEPG